MAKLDDFLADLFKLQAEIWWASDGQRELQQWLDDIQKSSAEVIECITSTSEDGRYAAEFQRSVGTLRQAIDAVSPVAEVRTRLRHYAVYLLNGKLTRREFMNYALEQLNTRSGFFVTGREERLEKILQAHSL